MTKNKNKKRPVKGYTIRDSRHVPYIEEKSFVKIPDKSATSEIFFSEDKKKIIYRSIYKEIGTVYYYKNKKEAEKEFKKILMDLKKYHECIIGHIDVELQILSGKPFHIHVK